MTGLDVSMALAEHTAKALRILDADLGIGGDD